MKRWDSRGHQGVRPRTMAVAQGRNVLPVLSLQRRGTHSGARPRPATGAGGSGLHRQQGGPAAKGQRQGERAALPPAPGQRPAPAHGGFVRVRRGASGRDWAHGGRVAEVGGEATVKRVGGLWPEVISFPNLLLAARRAAAGKRTRPDVAAFLLDLEPQLVRLQGDLRNGSYAPGPYHCFPISDPKPRLISAAPFRDRVAHHALTQVLEPLFEKRFSKDSFACRKGFGTHRALARAKDGARRCRYVLKCDVRKYFPSIDHAILKGLLARAVKRRPTLELAARIIDASNAQEEARAPPRTSIGQPNLPVFRQRVPGPARPSCQPPIAPGSLRALRRRLRALRRQQAAAGRNACIDRGGIVRPPAPNASRQEPHLPHRRRLHVS